MDPKDINAARAAHPDNAIAERRRLAARATAALHDLAVLDPNVIELAGIVAQELGALYPPVSPNAGPEDPPPHKP